MSSTNIVIPSGSSFPDSYLSTNLAAYSRGSDVIMTTSGLDNPLLLIRNPIGSNITIWLYRWNLGITTTNTAAEFKIFANPTVTSAGTLISAFQRNIGGNMPAASALITSLPVVSSPGNLLKNIAVGQNSNSIIIEERFSYALQPNNSILITGNPTSNARNAAVTFCWAETIYGL